MPDYTPETIPSKQCRDCNEWLPAIPKYFHRKADTKDGFHANCKKCRSQKEGFGYVTPEPDGYKRCSKCGELKPATTDHFWLDKRQSGPEALQARCRACAALYNASRKEQAAKYNRAYRTANADQIDARRRVYYEAHREQRSEYRRVYYQANKERYKEQRRNYRLSNKDRLSEYERVRRITRKVYRSAYGRVYYAANKDRLAPRNRAYYQANKERAAQRAREWRAANQERFRANIRTRKARKRNAEGRHTGKDIKQQYKAQRGKCYWCDCKVGNDYHVDHIIPLSRGGSNGPENIAIACAPCNLSKHNKLPTEWEGSNRLL